MWFPKFITDYNPKHIYSEVTPTEFNLLPRVYKSSAWGGEGSIVRPKKPQSARKSPFMHK